MNDLMMKVAITGVLIIFGDTLAEHVETLSSMI